MLLLTNHIGYERLGPKKAIIQTEQPHLSSYTAQLICATSEQTVATFAVEEQGKVANWHQAISTSSTFPLSQRQVTISCK